MVERISSLDTGYRIGDLSLYPIAQDSEDQLYQVTNNGETILKQSLSYNGKYLIVEDTSSFPDRGLVRIGAPAGEPGSEIIYYDKKESAIFRDLIRGFAGSRQDQWPVGSHIINSVMAEHHLAVRDAILQIQSNLGLRESPRAESLNGILKALETTFLAPKPIFRATPIRGAPPLRVRFQNFSTGDVIRSLWDFGDGTTSIEKSPIHTFQSEGIFTIKLNLTTSLGAQGSSLKNNYIVVDEEEKPAFFYVTPSEGFSVETAADRTAAGNPTDPTEFEFVDQTDGQISQRFWIFDGPGSSEGSPVENQTVSQLDPNIHTTTYTYDSPGVFEPSLLIISATQRIKRAFLRNEITVF